MKIKYSNLKIWFKEKVSQPRWYVDLFSYRRFWGALSIYSHLRRSDGKPNITYSTPSKAQKAVRSMLKGYVGSTSKRIGKLMRMVNTMQERLSDMGNGKGLPTDVFMQRKKILENILLKYSEE